MVEWFLNLDLIYQLILAFCLGGLVDTVFLIIIMYVKNNKINAYQRKLEKESIFSDESAAKVKVLEAKIQVLEKALENALNK